MHVHIVGKMLAKILAKILAKVLAKILVKILAKILVNKDLGQDLDQDLGQDLGQGLGHDLGQDLGQDLVPDHICGSKSRTDLIISGSGVTSPQISAGDIQNLSAPPNPHKKCIRTCFPGKHKSGKTLGG